MKLIKTNKKKKEEELLIKNSKVNFNTNKENRLLSKKKAK